MICCAVLCIFFGLFSLSRSWFLSFPFHFLDTCCRQFPNPKWRWENASACVRLRVWVFKCFVPFSHMQRNGWLLLLLLLFFTLITSLIPISVYVCVAAAVTIFVVNDGMRLCVIFNVTSIIIRRENKKKKTGWIATTVGTTTLMHTKKCENEKSSLNENEFWN